MQDIFYVDAVDDRVFAYTDSQVYEMKTRLYEFEKLYAHRRFFRCSKSQIVNLMKIESVAPILNGRLSAKLLKRTMRRL